MATSSRPYLNAVRAAVTRAMCIRNLPCQMASLRHPPPHRDSASHPRPQVERQNKPEVEYNVHPELMLPPVRRPRGSCAALRTA
jgi:hypothetical protein